LLFIDSESVRGNGKEFEVFLDTTKVRTYKDNQLLGVSVQSFSGYRNFPHVNPTNDEMVIRISNQAAGDFQLTDVYMRTLAPGDYPNINLLADAVMTQLQNAMDNYCERVRERGVSKRNGVRVGRGATYHTTAAPDRGAAARNTTSASIVPKSESHHRRHFRHPPPVGRSTSLSRGRVYLDQEFLDENVTRFSLRLKLNGTRFRFLQIRPIASPENISAP
jgi:hypothetical protein